MKKATYILGVLIFCLTCQIKAHDVAPRLISASGQGEIRLVPDEVVVTVGVEQRDPSVNEARKLTDSKASRIIAYLKRKGIDSKDIQTSYLSVQPYYGDEGNNISPSFYIAQKTMTFVLKELSAYDSVLEGLYEIGVNRVDDVSFRASNAKNYYDDAREIAVENAKEIASQLASELGIQVGDVYSVSENVYGDETQSYAYASYAEDSDEGSGPSIAGGSIIVTANVNVNFYIVDE